MAVRKQRGSFTRKLRLYQYLRHLKGIALPNLIASKPDIREFNNAKMTSGTPQHQAPSGLGAFPSRSGTPIENETSSRRLSTAEGSDGHGQSRPSSPARVILEQKDSTALAQIPGQQPPSGPREFSAELVGEIIKVIRQESKYPLRRGRECQLDDIAVPSSLVD